MRVSRRGLGVGLGIGGLAIGGLALLLLPSALAQQAGPEAKPIGSFVEKVRDEAPVGGGDILGATLRSSASDARSIYVRKPVQQAVMVCLTVTTIDGRYIASNSFELPDAPAGTSVRIAVNTRFPEYFANPYIEKLATAARMGACPSNRGDLLMVSWGAPAAGGAVKVGVPVQSGGQQAFLIVGEGANAKRIPCPWLKQGKMTSFDSVCEVDLALLSPGGVRARLERCNYGECTSAPAVRIRS